MNKQELIDKYWKKNTPGVEGFYNTRLIEIQWKKDKSAKISKTELDALLDDLKKNGK